MFQHLSISLFLLVHLRLIGMLAVDFLLVIIELFFARCFRFVTMHTLQGQTDGFIVAIPHLHSWIVVINHSSWQAIISLTFNVKPRLEWNGKRKRSQVCCTCHKIHCTVVILKNNIKTFTLHITNVNINSAYTLHYP